MEQHIQKRLRTPRASGLGGTGTDADQANDVPISARCFDTGGETSVPDLGDILDDMDLSTRPVQLEVVQENVTLLTTRILADLGGPSAPLVPSDAHLNRADPPPMVAYSSDDNGTRIEAHRTRSAADPAALDASVYNPTFTDVETDRRNEFDRRPFPARLELLENAIADTNVPASLGSLPSNAELPAFPTLFQTSQLFRLNTRSNMLLFSAWGALCSEASWPTSSAILNEAGMRQLFAGSSSWYRTFPRSL